MKNRLKQYFDLTQPYQFDIGDLTAIIYLICSVGVICGQNMTIPFLIGSIISTIFCFTAKRINLIVLNVSILAMNIYYLINMIWG